MSEQQQEAQLTLKDRLNMPYLIANQILTFQKSLLAVENSEREIIEAIKGLVNMIPDSWKDETFKKDMEKARVKRKVDVRPDWCGLRASKEFCEKHGIQSEIEEEVDDWYKAFQACINLLDRRGMLTKNQVIEQLEGVSYEFADTEILDSDISSE